MDAAQQNLWTLCLIAGMHRELHVAYMAQKEPYNWRTCTVL